MYTTLLGYTGRQSSYVSALFNAPLESSALLTRVDYSEHLVIATWWKKGLEPVHFAKTDGQQHDGAWYSVNSQYPAGDIYPLVFEVDDISTVLEPIEQPATGEFALAPSLI